MKKNRTHLNFVIWVKKKKRKRGVLVTKLWKGINKMLNSLRTKTLNQFLWQKHRRLEYTGRIEQSFTKENLNMHKRYYNECINEKYFMGRIDHNKKLIFPTEPNFASRFLVLHITVSSCKYYPQSSRNPW